MKIMLVMLRTMGDVILGTTLARELKRDHGEGAEVHFYVDRPYDALLRNNPWIDEVVVGDPWGLNDLYFEMSSGRYDVVYAPYQTRPECNVWHQLEEFRHQHLLDFYWQRMGMHRPIEERECYLFPSDEDRRKAEDHISLDVPRVAIHSTTGVSTKDWPRFDALAEELRKAGYGTVQVGARDDKPVAGAVDLRGKMGLLELAAFLSRCAAFVGLDSGISYISDAVRIPTIVIQGSTNPVTSGPISDRVKHLFAKKTGYADCETVRCHGNCRHERNCILEITVEDVLDILEEPMKSWRSPIPASV